MSQNKPEERADAAELALEILVRAYAALAGTFEAAHPEEFMALGPTMRAFLAESLRNAEAKMEDGRLTPEAFLGAVTHIGTAIQRIETVRAGAAA